jgi:hypothetical protein
MRFRDDALDHRLPGHHEGGIGGASDEDRRVCVACAEGSHVDCDGVEVDPCFCICDAAAAANRREVDSLGRPVPR